MDYQNQQNREEQGSSQQEQNNIQNSDTNMPTSAGGNAEYNENKERRNQQGNPQQQWNEERAATGERLRDAEADDKEPQIGSEGEFNPHIDDEEEFNNQNEWPRGEDLSDEERRETEDEDLGGRRSDDRSVL